MVEEYFDVLIVGAGLSGIAAGHHLQRDCPQKRYLILEARDSLGGTWDLFRYPGVRSDSDMYTLGYSFKPWTGDKSIADGATILQYLRETAAESGIDRHIRFSHRISRATWSSAANRWSVECRRPVSGETLVFSCSFLFMCGGYYDHAAGYTPALPGIERFRGRVVHPQHWPQEIDAGGQRVIVIGSGATAVSLAPALAKTAAQVTVLQRSPSWVIALPERDRLVRALARVMPARMASGIARWKNLLQAMAFYHLCVQWPGLAKKLLLAGVRRALGPDYDIATHFTPRYPPWDQRLCVVPDGDLFREIRAGRVTMVTDEIESVTPEGIRLRSGRELEADLIVTATGLVLQLMGGVSFLVDGVPVDFSKRLTYRGLMSSEVPNLAACLGYPNAPWTLRADLSCAYLCRLLNHMDRHGYARCTPRNSDASMTVLPWIRFSSGYVRRSIETLPKQGTRKPWRLYENYLVDRAAIRLARMDDGVLEFVRR